MILLLQPSLVNPVAAAIKSGLLLKAGSSTLQLFKLAVLLEVWLLSLCYILSRVNIAFFRVMENVVGLTLSIFLSTAFPTCVLNSSVS